MNGSWQDVAKNLGRSIGRVIKFSRKERLSGGCINQSWRLTDQNNKQWFVKTNSPLLIDMFMAELKALEEIADSQTIRVPKSYVCGANKAFSYLVLEHISLRSQINQSQMGKELARMHRIANPSKGEKSFGWTINNTIGITPQSNRTHRVWYSFYKDERLMKQLDYAKGNGYSSKAYDSGLLLADKLYQFFTQYAPKPSLLHGDLWAGNCASSNSGKPIIFDPAVYYGDRETDIAMTELFGGFNSDFYDAYNNEYPLDCGYRVRKNLYNLYHILNHYNLFGDGYASQAEEMTRKLLSEIK